MDRARHNRNYNLHSWTGVSLGLFVFVVCFSGCVALFYHELLAWEDPAKRITLTQTPAPFDETLTAWADDLETKGEIEFMNVSFPTVHEPYYSAYGHVHEEGGEHADHFARWHPQTLEIMPARGDGMALWLYDFHRDLMWPAELGGRTIGRALVGVAGVILMLSIITGVIAHTKIREELFSLRYLRSVRLKWQDTHKVLGLWGLPFYAMIAFTGAFLGIVALLAPITAVLAFKGDQEALIDAVIGEPPPAVGVEAQMLSMDDIAAMRHPESGYAPLYVITHNWGDEAAVFDVYFAPDTELKMVEAVSVSGATGEPVYNPAAAVDTPANRVVAAVTPLHYGTYGGIALKGLYFVLGLSLAVITALGMMMWIERRLHGNEGRRSAGFYRSLSRLNAGVCMGLIVASAGLFVHNTLYSGLESARLTWTGWTFFGIWFAAVSFSFLRKDEYRATAEMMAAASLALIAASILNGSVTDHPFWKGFGADGHAPTAWVDVALLALGAAGLGLASVLPKKRPEARHKTNLTPAAAPAE